MLCEEEKGCVWRQHIVLRPCSSGTGRPKGGHILCLPQCCWVLGNIAALEMATGNQRKIMMNSLSHTFISISISSVSLTHTHTPTHTQATNSTWRTDVPREGERSNVKMWGFPVDGGRSPHCSDQMLARALLLGVCVQWTYVASERNTDRCLLPKWHSGKESAYQCRRLRRFRFNPWVRKIPWRRAWQPTPVFLPGESHGQRSLVGYSPWGCKELDTTEWLIHDIPLLREVTCIFLKQSRPRAEAWGCGPLPWHGHSYPDPPHPTPALSETFQIHVGIISFQMLPCEPEVIWNSTESHPWAERFSIPFYITKVYRWHLVSLHLVSIS